MSTNDTLRGLLFEAKQYIQGSRFTNGLLARIDAALAEPVSGGVIDERAAFEAYESKERRLSPDDQKIWFRPGAIADYDFRSIDDAWKAWQARAALNGGAVAGQAVCGACHGERVVDDGFITHSASGIEYSSPIKRVKDCPACTCKGGE